MKKKQLLGSGCAAVLVLLLIGIWNLWFSSTRVAFVNYQFIYKDSRSQYRRTG